MPRIRNPLSRVMIVLSAALIAVALALHVVNLGILRDDVRSTAEGTTRNLAKAFAEHTARTFEAADRALLAAVALYNDSGTDLRNNPAEAHAALADIQRVSDVLQSLSWSAADGRLIASSAYIRPPPFNATAQEHFRAHAERDGIGLFIGRPFTTQLSGVWANPLSRRLSRPDGTFDGVAAALIDLSYFKKLYNSVNIGRTQTIALVRRDGTFIMREPQVEAALEQSIASSPLFSRYLPQAEEGTFSTVGVLDGQTRIISYAAIRGYPVLVTVSLAEDEAMAGWHRQLIFTSSAFLAFLILYLVVAILLIQKLERDEDRRREIEAARAAAEAANSAKSDFLSNMSHELRTPLNAVLGYAEMIRDRHLGPAREEKYAAYAGDIHTAALHLLDLINGLLDLSKIEAGRWILNETRVDLRSVVDGVIRQQRLVAENAHLELSSNLPPTLPALWADERAISQMLLNLVFNSIKFTPAGGRIEISASVKNDGLALVVRDTGIGISPEIKATLFNRFARPGTPLIRTSGGAGLGLSIVKGLIELHGGRIELANAAGQGTEVTLHFPASRLITIYAAA